MRVPSAEEKGCPVLLRAGIAWPQYCFFIYSQSRLELGSSISLTFLLHEGRSSGMTCLPTLAQVTKV